jgi:hypothetical protein
MLPRFGFLDVEDSRQGVEVSSNDDSYSIETRPGMKGSWRDTDEAAPRRRSRVEEIFEVSVKLAAADPGCFFALFISPQIASLWNALDSKRGDSSSDKRPVSDGEFNSWDSHR